MIKKVIVSVLVLLISSNSFALDREIESAVLKGDWESVYQLLNNDSLSEISPTKQHLLLESSVATNRFTFLDESLRIDIRSLAAWSNWTKRLLKNNPNNPYALFLAADGEFFNKNLKKSIDLYKKAIKKKKDFALAYEGRAEAYTLLGKHKKARSDCNKAIKINPMLGAAYAVRGLANQFLGKNEDAIEDFNQALVIIPNDIFTLNNRGLIHLEASNYEKAIIDFTAAILIDSTDEVSYNNRGLTFVKTAEYDRASNDFDRNISTSNNLLSYIYKSYAYEIQGKYKEAYESIKLAVISQGDTLKIMRELPSKETDVPALELKAKDGDYKARFKLAKHLLRKPTENTFPIAFDLLQKSAAQNYPPAQASLGLVYISSEFVERDFQKAHYWLLKGAQNDDTTAQFSVGLMYRRGDFVKQDDAQAIKWFFKAAVQGMASASFNIGMYYERGIIYEQSYDRAFKWFKRAALKGYAVAEYNVGSYYQKGSGIEANQQLGYIWYRLSAEHRDIDAQLQVGGAYALGDVMPLNDVLASMWFLQSAVRGDAGAKKSLGIIQSQNPKEVNEKAVEMAWNWKDSWPHY